MIARAATVAGIVHLDRAGRHGSRYSVPSKQVENASLYGLRRMCNSCTSVVSNIAKATARIEKYEETEKKNKQKRVNVTRSKGGTN